MNKLTAKRKACGWEKKLTSSYVSIKAEAEWRQSLSLIDASDSELFETHPATRLHIHTEKQAKSDLAKALVQAAGLESAS